MADSQRLLGDHATNGSERAFRDLVASSINLAYSTAVRLVHGDAHLAQDVTHSCVSALQWVVRKYGQR